MTVEPPTITTSSICAVESSACLRTWWQLSKVFSTSGEISELKSSTLKLSEKEIDDVKELQKDLSKFISERTFANKMDLEFFKKIEETADT